MSSFFSCFFFLDVENGNKIGRNSWEAVMQNVDKYTYLKSTSMTTMLDALCLSK